MVVESRRRFGLQKRRPSVKMHPGITAGEIGAVYAGDLLYIRSSYGVNIRKVCLAPAGSAALPGTYHPAVLHPFTEAGGLCASILK